MMQQQQQQTLVGQEYCNSKQRQRPVAARAAANNFPVWKKWVIEFIATYVILFAITMVAGQSTSLLLTATSQGLILFHAIGTFYRSGPHANFLATILALVAKSSPRVNFITLIVEIVLQFAAAALAGLTTCAFLGSSSNLGITQLDGAFAAGTGFALEALISFAFYLTVLVVSTNYHKDGHGGLLFNNPALVVGSTLWVLVLVAGPITGGCINPLRHFAVAIFVGFESYSWIYYVGPLVGAVGALIFFILFFKERSNRK